MSEATVCERWRPAANWRNGSSFTICGLQGEIGFAAAERAMWSFEGLKAPGTTGRWLVLDFSRVGRVHPAAGALLGAMASELGEAGVMVVVADANQRGVIPGLQEFRSLDAAVESCEDALLKDLAQGA